MRSWRRGALWGSIAAAVALAFVFISGPTVGAAVAAIQQAARGADGPATQAAVYGLAAAFTFLTVFLPLPAEASALVNGTVFGSTEAFLLTWIMAMAGAAASYEVGRRFGRRPARRLFGLQRLERVEGLIDRAGWPVLLALRLSPVMAFTAINWASGILALSRPVFYWTTGLGLIPGTYVFTVVPHLAADPDSAGKLVFVALAAMVGLLGFAAVRVRAER